MAFEIGNKYAQEWTLENALPRFEDALKDATENENCLCMQDAVSQTGIPITTFYYLIDTHDVLKSIKADINAQIIRRINKNALNNLAPSPASPSIWRMKQLGEKDEQTVNSTNLTRTEITVSSREDKEQIDNLIKKFEDE